MLHLEAVFLWVAVVGQVCYSDVLLVLPDRPRDNTALVRVHVTCRFRGGSVVNLGHLTAPMGTRPIWAI